MNNINRNISIGNLIELVITIITYLDFGFLKLDSTTKAGEKREIEFKTGASHNVASQKLFGSLDIKYKLPVYGIK